MKKFKKLLSIALSLCILAGFATTAGAESKDVPIRFIKSVEEIPKQIVNDENIVNGLNAIYIIENDKSKAICYNCGRPSLTINQIVEEHTKVISCHGGGYGSDFFIELKFYNGEKCSSCGLNSKVYWNTK